MKRLIEINLKKRFKKESSRYRDTKSARLQKSLLIEKFFYVYIRIYSKAIFLNNFQMIEIKL